MLHTEHDVAPAELANFPFGQKLHLAWPSFAAYRPTPQSSHSPRRVSWVLAFANFPAGHSMHALELGSKYLPGSWHSNVGCRVGSRDGSGDGSSVGCEDGSSVGPNEGAVVGDSDGSGVGARVGPGDGRADGANDG